MITFQSSKIFFIGFVILLSCKVNADFSSAFWQRQATFINHTVAVGDAAGTSLVLPAQAHYAQNLIVVFVKYEDLGPTMVTAADTIGNTYTALTTKSHSNNDLHGVFLYALSTSSNANNVITITWSAARTFRKVAALQYSGIRMVDTEASGEGASGLPLTSNNLTTTAAGFAIAASGEYQAQSGYSPGAGWTERWDGPVDNGYSGVAVQDIQYVLPSTFGATMTQSSPGAWILVVAAFK